jgi:glucosylglycerate synthase
MASSPANTAAAAATTATVPSDTLLINLAPLSLEALESALSNLALAFPTQSVLVALPGGPSLAPQASFNTLKLLPYTPQAPISSSNPLLTAADFLNTWKLAQENNAGACLLLGAESNSLPPESIRALAAAAFSNSDLTVAHYRLRPNEGLVNSAILYPVTRALYCAGARFPLALDLGLSLRMTERLAMTAQRFTAASDNEALVWPVAEAAVANYASTEVEIPTRSFPQPPTSDLNTILGQVAGSLFADIETKANFWQRMRTPAPVRTRMAIPVPIDSLPDFTPMVDAFHLAYNNLLEIWSLVLPPQSLLGLKRLSVLPAADFNMPDSLWARIVYDFILAWRLRTLNRGHLLGALTPLYLAWAASHLALIRNGTPPEQHIEELARVFEADKPYLVSRWRWPDRFNP